jgi:hypothetical protein
MPTIITQGAASAKALGFAQSAGGGGTLQTVTFTTSGTWSAPVGVSNVSTISGYGQDGSASYGSSTFTFNAAPGFGTEAPFAQWGDLYSAAVSTQSALASSVGNYGPSSFLGAIGIRVASDNKWGVLYESYDDLSYAIIDTVSAVFAGSGSPQTSGNIAYSGLSFSAWNVSAGYHAPAFVGAASTALGQTFPGGSYGPATTTTYTNVAVTPGNTYTISVASGGSITIQYYA